MNAKIEKTRQSLLDAFCRLAETMPIDEITVTRLCQEAQVNRTTFYRYYSIPIDVIVQKAEEVTAETLYSEAYPMENTYEFMRHICRCYYDNRHLMIVYLKAIGDLFPLYYKMLNQHLPQARILLDPTKNFIAGGVTSTVMAWILRDCPESPDQLAAYLVHCIKKLEDA